MCKSNLQMPQKFRLRRMTGPKFLRHLETGQKILPRSLCLGALPLLYPAAPPSVFDYCIVKYTAPAVALVREYVVDFWNRTAALPSTQDPKHTGTFYLTNGVKNVGG